MVRRQRHSSDSSSVVFNSFFMHSCMILAVSICSLYSSPMNLMLPRVWQTPPPQLHLHLLQGDIDLLALAGGGGGGHVGPVLVPNLLGLLPRHLPNMPPTPAVHCTLNLRTVRAEATKLQAF